MAIRSSSTSCCCLLVVGLLLLPPAAVAGPDWGKFCPCLCRCMEDCSDRGNSLEFCVLGCVVSSCTLTSKEVAVGGWPDNVAWGKFCPCMCSCMVSCSGKGTSLEICGPACVIGCNKQQQEEVAPSTTSWANSTA